jgi:hypothetical protein
MDHQELACSHTQEDDLLLDLGAGEVTETKGRLEFFGRTGGLLLPLLRCTVNISLIKPVPRRIARTIPSPTLIWRHAVRIRFARQAPLGEVNEYLR